MQVFVLFGLPGAGKTFIGKALQEHFNFHLYDGDIDLTAEMKEAIRTEAVFTNDMRDLFFKKVIKRALELQAKYDRLVIAQTFIKEKYREQLLGVIPGAKFILVHADERIRKERLAKRIEFPIAASYAMNMSGYFDTTLIEYSTINNNSEGTEEIRKQFSLLLSR